jgi:hypothetical protein
MNVFYLNLVFSISIKLGLSLDAPKVAWHSLFELAWKPNKCNEFAFFSKILASFGLDI